MDKDRLDKIKELEEKIRNLEDKQKKRAPGFPKPPDGRLKRFFVNNYTFLIIICWFGIPLGGVWFCYDYITSNTPITTTSSKLLLVVLYLLLLLFLAFLFDGIITIYKSKPNVSIFEKVFIFVRSKRVDSGIIIVKSFLSKLVSGPAKRYRRFKDSDIYLAIHVWKPAIICIVLLTLTFFVGSLVSQHFPLPESNPNRKPRFYGSSVSDANFSYRISSYNSSTFIRDYVTVVVTNITNSKCFIKHISLATVGHWHGMDGRVIDRGQAEVGVKLYPGEHFSVKVYMENLGNIAPDMYNSLADHITPSMGGQCTNADYLGWEYE